MRGSGRGNVDSALTVIESSGAEKASHNPRREGLRDFTEDIGIDEQVLPSGIDEEELDQEEEDAFNEELAGLPYHEWLRRQNERREAKIRSRNETHVETDFGASYFLDPRAGELGLGWKNYRPLPPSPSPDDLRRLHPATRNRHLWHHCAAGDLPTVDALLAAGADPAAGNNESFLPARLRFGLCLRDPTRPISESCVAEYGEQHPHETVSCVYGWTALHWAVNGGHAAVVRRLLGPPARCDPAARDWRNLTAAHIAASPACCAASRR